jgi:hypothetical protein
MKKRSRVSKKISILSYYLPILVILLRLFSSGQAVSAIGGGGIGVSCNVVVTATSLNPGFPGGCTALNLITSGGFLPSIYTWQVITAGAPSSVTVNFMGSLDGVTWTQIDTTSAAGTRTVANQAYRFVGCVPATLSGGTSPTVTCLVSVSGFNSTQTGNNSFTGTNTFKSISNTLYLDTNNSAGWAGSDLGAWINSAVAAAPSTGCEINMEGVQGTVTMTTTAVISKPCLLRFARAGTVNILCGLNPCFQPTAINVHFLEGQISLNALGAWAIQPLGTVNGLTVEHMTIVGDSNRTGTITLANGGSTVTGTGTNFQADWAGGILDVLSAGTEYFLTINSVNVPAQTMVISGTFSGTTVTTSAAWGLNNSQIGVEANSGNTLGNQRYINNTLQNLSLGLSCNANLSGTIDGCLIIGNYLTDINCADTGCYGIHIASGLTQTVNSVNEMAPINARVIGNVTERVLRHSLYIAKGSGISLESNTDRWHRLNWAAGVERSAIVIARSTDVTARGNLVLDSNDGGIEIETDNTAPIGCRNIVVDANIIRNVSGWYPMTVGTAAPATDGFCQGVIISSNAVYQDNTATNGFGGSIVFIYSGKQVYIDSNRINLLNAATTQSIVQIRGIQETSGTALYTDDIQFRNNFINVTTNGGSAYGYEFYNTAATSGINATFSNNQLTGTVGTFLFDLTQTDPNIKLLGNTVSGTNFVTSLIKPLDMGPMQATSIVPVTAGGGDVGATLLPWANLWLGTAATNNFKFQPAATAAARIVQIADPGATSGLLLGGTNLTFSPTAPTIAGAGCGGTVAAIQNPNGTASFNIFTGTAPTSGGCTITMPAATTDWHCEANHVSAISTTNFIIQQTGALSTTSVTLQLFSDVAAATAPTASDTWRVTCTAN